MSCSEMEKGCKYSVQESPNAWGCLSFRGWLFLQHSGGKDLTESRSDTLNPKRLMAGVLEELTRSWAKRWS